MIPPILRRLLTTPLGIILVVLSTLSLISMIALHGPTRDKLVLSLPDSWLLFESNLLDAPLPMAYDAYFPDKQLPRSLRRRELAPLTDRLVKFLHRPALNYDEAVGANHAACPLHVLAQLTSPQQLEDHRGFWNAIDSNQIAHRRAELVSFLAKNAKTGRKVLGTTIKGPITRGIVLTAGNGDTVLRVVMLLKHLKRIGNTLPVEVVHFPDELNDRKYRRQLQDLGAKLIKVRGVVKTPGMWKNYQIKAMAMIQTSFTEMVYLDSDNVPLRTLEHLFDAPLYVENGRAAFWPDIKKDHADNAIWRIVGDTCTLKEWTFESGQIVFDKRGNDGNNLAALWIAAAMLDKNDFWYGLCGGDKDTYRWAFRMLDIPYAPAPRWVSALGIQNEFDNNKFCGHTMLQYDLVTPEGADRPQALFVHANLLKHLDGRLERGKVFSYVKHMALDAYDEETLNHVFFYVYHGKERGMCTDMFLHDEAASLMDADKLAVQRPVVVSAKDVPELEGFEDAWWEAGGRVGGW
ncbi:hypothetical protein CcaverHIS002_0309550 [Cutaneotrichosporon cavernicola]|nr:hypothetical protein CcaverHIS002_0309550 [Cutaneotrichosporon cavernicola]BEI98648.1 hypothetical protein CcaverHIS631_0309470 [Cutaneotrichosporon cavernicola]BEJ06418.1 hypothetical protein CcaverHIS641_0309400 [Cutaneotrichosporon cavernicola]